jgi:NitT/TauT family transport system ATP-binding protein
MIAITRFNLMGPLVTMMTNAPLAPSGPRLSGGDIIEVRNVGRSFSVNQTDLTVFENLSYRVKQGSFLSIVGPSGCGKSTLLKLIAGLDTPSQGEIYFEGRKVTGPAQGMIYVFQQYTKSIFPWRTVLENIDFGLQSHKRLPRKQAQELCMEYVKLVGLDGYENYFPYQLSGGMQQRVVIARALICEPKVLLMDEPFSAVDALTRAILQELILKIWSTIPVTILFVTHDVEEAVFLSSHIFSLTKAPARIHQDLDIGLAYPRDPIATRAEPIFTEIRQKLFSSIFLQEKGAAPAYEGAKS